MSKQWFRLKWWLRNKNPIKRGMRVLVWNLFIRLNLQIISIFKRNSNLNQSLMNKILSMNKSRILETSQITYRKWLKEFKQQKWKGPRMQKKKVYITKIQDQLLNLQNRCLTNHKSKIVKIHNWIPLNPIRPILQRNWILIRKSNLSTTHCIMDL